MRVDNEVENVCSEVLLFRVRWSDLSPVDHIDGAIKSSLRVQQQQPAVEGGCPVDSSCVVWPAMAMFNLFLTLAVFSPPAMAVRVSLAVRFVPSGF